MWCNRCQQDVPAVAHAATGDIVCARCGRDLSDSRPVHNVGICDSGVSLDEPLGSQAENPVAAIHDDRTTRRFREMARALRIDSRRLGGGPSIEQSQLRFDPPQNLVTEIERLAAAPQAHTPRPTVAATHVRRRKSAGGGSWACVFAGVFTFGAGIGLAGWSVAAPRPEFWNAALGLTLAGQGILILGLLAVLVRLWRSSRAANTRLAELNFQMAELHRTANTIAGQQSTSAPAFYAELARGANPQMLLASLRGQLEQLAGRIGTDAA